MLNNLELFADLYKKSFITVEHKSTGGHDTRTEDNVFSPDIFAELNVAECMKLNCKELSITAIER